MQFKQFQVDACIGNRASSDRLRWWLVGAMAGVCSLTLPTSDGRAQSSLGNTATRPPNITFVHPDPTPAVSNNVSPNQGGAGGQDHSEHKHGNESESVTNNYYGYGWPNPFFVGPCYPGQRVTNYYNGVPVYFGYGYPLGYPYVGSYGATWYGQRLNGSLGFPAVFNAGPLQPNFMQPNFNQAGFPLPGGFAPGIVNAPVIAPDVVKPAAFPRAVDAFPANRAVTEIQRRVDVLKPSTPEGRLRADRLLAQGDVSFAAQRYAVASAKYQDAIAKAPDYPTSHFRLAHCNIASGNFDLALTRFLMALELAGSAERVNFSLEQLYQGDKFAKQTHFDRLQDAIQREPDDGGLVFLMGLTLHYHQNPVQAREMFVKSQSMPGTHQAYVHYFLPVVPIAEPK